MKSIYHLSTNIPSHKNKGGYIPEDSQNTNTQNADFNQHLYSNGQSKAFTPLSKKLSTSTQNKGSATFHPYQFPTPIHSTLVLFPSCKGIQ